MKRLVAVACLAVLGSAGCQSKVTGTLEVDGSPFAAKLCRSGQAFGFNGIELSDEAGRRLRLLANADGTCTAALFKGDGATGDTLGPCGALRMQAQSSRINCFLHLGTMPHWMTVKNITLFAEEVIPKLRSKAPDLKVLPQAAE